MVFKTVRVNPIPIPATFAVYVFATTMLNLITNEIAGAKDVDGLLLQVFPSLEIRDIISFYSAPHVAHVAQTTTPSFLFLIILSTQCQSMPCICIIITVNSSIEILKGNQLVFPDLKTMSN